MTQYKLLVLDIDDTLMTSDNQISQPTYDALMQLQTAGYYLVLASGRPLASMIETARHLKLDTFNSYIISYNGATITQMNDLSELFSQRIDLDEQSAIIDYIQSHGLTVLTYQNNEILMDKHNEYSDTESRLTGLPQRYDATAIAQLDTPRLKFIGVGDPEVIKTCDNTLQGTFGHHTYATTSKPFFLEFMHASVSKGAAIQRLCDHLGITTAQVIACGDGNNDVSMLETAGLGVAMGNATPLLKSVADVVTLSNDEDGLVPIIQHYFLAQ